MASKNNGQNQLDIKRQREHEQAMLKVDLYSVFHVNSGRLIWPGSTGVPKDQAEALSRGVIADSEIRIVRPGIK